MSECACGCGEPGSGKYRRGHNMRLFPSWQERFWSKVDKTDGCWLWTGYIPKNGYGRFGIDRTMVLAHRLAYTEVVGPIPEGLQLDHLCRNRRCVNPEHLEPVTQQENSLRGITGEHLKNDGTCRNGLHPWPESAKLYGDGKQRCGLCEPIREQRRRDKNKLRVTHD